MNYLQLLLLDSGLYKVDHLTLNTLVHLVKTCESSGVTSDYIKKIPLDLWFNDFWDKLGKKIDYITINITNNIMYNTNECIQTRVGHIYYDTLDDYEYYINNINGYLCLYSINKIINLETMKVSYEVRDCVVTNHSIQRDFVLDKLMD